MKNSPFIEIEVNDKIKVVKKSSYYWLLEEGNGKISTDRLRRFITGNKTNKRTKNYTTKSKKKQRYIKVSSSSSEDEICNDSKKKMFR